MTLEEFNRSIATDAVPPDGLGLAVQSLWWDAKGDWEKAHRLAQEDPNPNATWVHAYLHRREGDETNAAYWYAKAVKPMATGPFSTERDHIVATLLADALAGA